MENVRILPANEIKNVTGKFSLLISTEPNFGIVEKKSSDDKTVTKTIQKAPDGVLIDVILPETSGKGDLCKFKQQLPRVTIIGLKLRSKSLSDKYYLSQGLPELYPCMSFQNN